MKNLKYYQDYKQLLNEGSAFYWEDGEKNSIDVKKYPIGMDCILDYEKAKEYVVEKPTSEKKQYLQRLDDIWHLTKGKVSINFHPNKLTKTADIVPTDDKIKWGGIFSVPLNALKKA